MVYCSDSFHHCHAGLNKGHSDICMAQCHFNRPMEPTMLYPVSKKTKKTLKGCVSFLLFHSAYTLKSTLLTQGDHQPLLTWPAGPYTHHITPSAMSPAHETTVSALGSKKELHEHSRSNKGVRSIFFSLDNEFHISEGKLTLPSSWMYLNARSLPEKPITECRERSRVSVCMCMYAFVVLWLHGGS